MGPLGDRVSVPKSYLRDSQALGRSEQAWNGKPAAWAAMHPGAAQKNAAAHAQQRASTTCTGHAELPHIVPAPAKESAIQAESQRVLRYRGMHDVDRAVKLHPSRRQA
eukprot:scaffold298461_cov35-Tisochrysis_lutea.AAC.2